MAISALQAVHITVLCVTAGIFVNAIESLWLWSKGYYDDSGILPWAVAREIYSERVGAALSPVMSNGGVLVLTAARLVCASALLLGYDHWAYASVPLAILVATQFLLQMRTHLGGEGADQMTSLVLVTGLVAEAGRGLPAVMDSAALFIGAQITLSYLASGGAKLLGPMWRGGTALAAIMNHHTYGHPRFSRFLRDYPLIARAMCIAVIGFQVTFFVFYILPMPYALIYVLGGIAFHAGIAYFMRLNLFFVTFIGTYPCLIYTHEAVRAFALRLPGILHG
jgi:hypothetical protein